MSKETLFAQGLLIDKADEHILDEWPWHNHKGYVHAVATLPSKKRITLILARMILRPEDDNLVVDHINQNTLDNRRCNLRVLNRGENRANTNKIPETLRKAVFNNL
jgi:hypothetical protein